MASVSPKGRATLKHHEGEVLKAYRDPVGVWTIGVGLTAASGVIVPKAGMVITSQESDRLLDLALTRNYLPAVTKALGAGAADQGAIDGATSFHFNTGAIAKASWVKAYRAGDNQGTRRGLGMWTKAKGKVLPGLVRRRADEADMILLGRYPVGIKVPTAVPDTQFAVFVVPVTEAEKVAIFAGFRQIGHPVDTTSGKPSREAVEKFQSAYALTVDGRIGKATLSTLQRELDGRSKTRSAAGVSLAGAGGGGTAAIHPASIDVAGISGDAMVWLGAGTVALAAIYAAWLAWSYRDLVAVRITEKLPRVAAYLRSI